MDRATPSGLRELMRQYDLRPKKFWGQNFLVDKNVLHKIVGLSGIGPEHYVVEIGPGMGALSQLLAATARGLLAIEIDRSLEPVLNDLSSEHDNLHILWGDVLKVDIETELSRYFGVGALERFVVCANIPYQITSPIIFKLLQDCPHLEAATLMMQTEVADRLLAAPGSKEYGRLSVMAAYYARLEPLMSISRHCFYPQPEVESSLVRLIPRPIAELNADQAVLDRMVRAAFQQRRKTLLNVLVSEWKGDKEDFRQRLEELGLDPRQRPETLSLEDFLRLTRALS